MSLPWVARTLLFGCLLAGSLQAQEDPSDWTTYSSTVRLYLGFEEQLILADFAKGELVAMHADGSRICSMPTRTPREIEFITSDDMGGLWIFGDPIASGLIWLLPQGSDVWKVFGAESGKKNRQLLEAFSEAYDLYGGHFEIGTHHFPYKPSFGKDGDVAVLNDRQRLLLTTDSRTPITGNELPDDRVVGQPAYAMDGRVRLEGEKGVYALTINGAQRAWHRIAGVSDERKARKPAFPKSGNPEGMAWVAPGRELTWSANDFELVLRVGKTTHTYILDGEHPLRNYTGEVAAGMARHGIWWFDGKTESGKRQIAIFRSDAPNVEVPGDRVFELSARQNSLKEQLVWSGTVPAETQVWVQIGKEAWTLLEGIPILEAGSHPMQMQIFSAEPLLWKRFDNLRLDYEWKLERELELLLIALGSVDFRERQQAESRFMELRDLEVVVQWVRDAARKTDDPEVAFRLYRILYRIGGRT